MQPVALTRASELIQITDAMDRFGLSPDRVMRRAKLPMWHFCDPDDLIPSSHIYTLMDEAARSLGTPAFGLLAGVESSITTMGSYGAMIAGSLTTHHALTRSCRLIHLHNAGSQLSLAEAGDNAWFYHSAFEGPESGRRQKELYVLMRMIDHVRLGAGPAWQPAKVCLQTYEAPERELQGALGDPEIRLGRKVTAIAVPRALLALPLSWSRGSGEAVEKVQDRLRHTAPAAGFVDTLRQLVGTMLKQDEPPRVEIMAEITGLSVRSLQRRLAENELNYSQIVDQARYQAATRLLGDADVRITDVAMDLGYTDSAHFTRAFKRWAGVTPREYRRYQQAL